jgi:hypothetical protein
MVPLVQHLLRRKYVEKKTKKTTINKVKNKRKAGPQKKSRV